MPKMGEEQGSPSKGVSKASRTSWTQHKAWWWLTGAFLIGFLVWPTWPWRTSTKPRLAERDANACRPQELHLGVTPDPTTLRVTWRTIGSLCPNYVRYRRLNETFFRTAYGFTYDGRASQLCGWTAAAHDYQWHFHTVLLKDLDAEEGYGYRLPLDTVETNFFTRKPAGSSTPFAFFALASTGVTRGPLTGMYWVQNAMLQNMRNYGMPDFFLHAGDLAMADGRPSDWELFMQQIASFARSIPWIAGVGDHEYDIQKNDLLADPWGSEPYHPSWGNLDFGASDGECGLPMFWRFPSALDLKPETFLMTGTERHLSSPSHGSPFSPFYFAFRHGTVHVIFLSTEHSVEPDSAQRAWLEEELALVDRCATPFVVVVAHRPFYAPASHPGDYLTGLGLQKQLEDLLIGHRVDVLLTGQIYNYYRLCEAKGGVCVNTGEGLVSINVGSGGHPLRPLQPKDFEFANMTVHVSWGFGRFNVKGSECMEFEFIEAESGRAKDTHTFWNQNLCQTNTS